VADQNKNITNNNSIPNPPKPKSSPVSHSKLSLLSLIIALLAAGGTSVNYFQSRSWDARLNDIQTKTERRIVNQQIEINSLQTEFEKMNKHIASEHKKIHQQLQDYHTAILPILQSKQIDNSAWLLQKVCYRLQQAQFDLHWGQNPEGALILLKEANSLLKTINLPSLANLKTSLSNDIKTLSSQPIANTADLFNQINTLSEKLIALPMPKAPPENQVPPPSRDSLSAWQKFAAQSMDALKKIVVIRKTDAVNPIPKQQTRALLNQSLFLALQEAQWALLRKNHSLFQSEIAQIIKTITQNNDLIDRNAPETEHLIAELQALSAQKITPDIPDLTANCPSILKAEGHPFPSRERLPFGPVRGT